MDWGHTTKEYHHLKNEVEKLIRRGYLAEFVTKDKAVLAMNEKEKIQLWILKVLFILLSKCIRTFSLSMFTYI